MNIYIYIKKVSYFLRFSAHFPSTSTATPTMSPVEGGIQVVEGICAEKRKNLDTFWAMADQKNASTFGGSGSREVHLTKYFWGGRRPKIILIFMFFSTCPFHLHRHPQQM